MSLEIESQLNDLTIVVPNTPESEKKKAKQSENQFLLQYCKRNIIHGFLYFGWIILTIFNIQTLVLEDETSILWTFLLTETCVNASALNTYMGYYMYENKYLLYPLSVFNVGTIGVQIWGMCLLDTHWERTELCVINVTNITLTVVYYLFIIYTFPLDTDTSPIETKSHEGNPSQPRRMLY